MKLYFILGGLGLLLLFVLLTALLYWLGDSDQSALERLRDIAIIYIVLLTLTIVILLGACTAALVYLVFQIRDRVIPLLGEMNATLKTVRGTTEFMSEEAVKPVINVASKVAQWRAIMRAAAGSGKKRR
jgi:heme A synthase